MPQQHSFVSLFEFSAVFCAIVNLQVTVKWIKKKKHESTATKKQQKILMFLFRFNLEKQVNTYIKEAKQLPF